MSAPRRGRRPDAAIDTAVREAVIALLFERGFAMTYDEVAARAGVGRATVFRRFPTKRELVLDAIAGMTFERLEVPDTGSVRDDLVGTLVDLTRVFGEPQLRGFARQFVGEACRDPAFTDAFRATLEGRLRLIGGILERGVARGELPASVDARLVADMVSGVLLVRLATDTPLPDADEIARLVDTLLDGSTTPPDDSTREQA